MGIDSSEVVTVPVRMGQGRHFRRKAVHFIRDGRVFVVIPRFCCSCFHGISFACRGAVRQWNFRSILDTGIALTNYRETERQLSDRTTPGSPESFRDNRWAKFGAPLGQVSFRLHFIQARYVASRQSVSVCGSVIFDTSLEALIPQPPLPLN